MASLGVAGRLSMHVVTHWLSCISSSSRGMRALAKTDLYLSTFFSCWTLYRFLAIVLFFSPSKSFFSLSSFSRAFFSKAVSLLSLRDLLHCLVEANFSSALWIIYVLVAFSVLLRLASASSTYFLSAALIFDTLHDFKVVHAISPSSEIRFNVISTYLAFFFWNCDFVNSFATGLFENQVKRNAKAALKKNLSLTFSS